MIDSHQSILNVLQEVRGLIDQAFADCNGLPPNGSALDQAGLKDGAHIVEDYLGNNEAGVALEHLIYMISEPKFRISLNSFHHIERAAKLLKIDQKLVESIRP